MIDVEALLKPEVVAVDAAEEGDMPSECVASCRPSCNERSLSSGTDDVTGTGDDSGTGDGSGSGDVDMLDVWQRRCDQ